MIVGLPEGIPDPQKALQMEKFDLFTESSLIPLFCLTGVS